MTFLSMMNSGTDAAAVESMNANAVPTGSPLLMSSPVMGMTDDTFAYVGMPMTTARGTVHHCPLPRCATTTRKKWRAVDEG